MSEAALKKRVLAWLREQGAYAVKTAPPMDAGTPDVLVCWPPSGRLVAIELKVGRNKPTALQRRRLEEVEQAGGHALVAYSLEEVIASLASVSPAE